MIILLSNLGVSTSSYDGHPLKIVVENIASLGFKMIEIAAVTGWTEHIVPENMTLKDFKEVEHLLTIHKLKSHSFSGHVDLGKFDSIDKFKRRIDFAEFIGAPIINTFTTHPDNIDLFLKNIDVLADYALKKGIKIGLETHGDLIDKGKESVEILKRIDKENVGINYDPGNATFFNKGISIIDDASIICKSGYLIHVHYKEVLFSKTNKVSFPGLGKGMVNWGDVINQLKKYKFSGPMSLELELNLYGKQGDIKLGKKKSIKEIDFELISASNYLEKLFTKS